MVEIGFSIGSRKQHFLIWNARKAPFEVWEKLKKPAILYAENVDVIDNFDDLAATRNVLENKLARRAQARLHSSNCPHCLEVSKIENKRAAYVYCQYQELKDFLDDQLQKHGIFSLVSEDARADARVCRICQSLRLADFVLIEISDDNLDSFIVLGMAKAIGVKTLLFALDKYERRDFPWAQEIVLYQIDRLAERLISPISKFLAH